MTYTLFVRLYIWTFIKQTYCWFIKKKNRLKNEIDKNSYRYIGQNIVLRCSHTGYYSLSNRLNRIKYKIEKLPGISLIRRTVKVMKVIILATAQPNPSLPPPGYYNITKLYPYIISTVL